MRGDKPAQPSTETTATTKDEEIIHIKQFLVQNL